MSAAGKMTTPEPLLAGQRVIDFSTGIAGPSATMYLADHGATVTKVETHTGDPLRSEPGFQTLNRGKQSVLVSYSSACGQATVRALLRSATIVVTDITQTEAAGLGIDYATVQRLNPRALYLSMPPYGNEGPLVGRPASPALLAAVSGIMATQISPDGSPMHHRLPLAAYGTGVTAAMAIMAALRSRIVHDAPGQMIEVSQLAGAMALVHGADREMLNRHPMGCTGPIAPYRCYRAGDGQWFFLACANERFFKRMLAALDLTELADHPDAADAWVFTNQAAAPRELLVPRLSAAFASKPRAHWLRVLEEADVPVAPIQSRDEFFKGPYVAENDMRVQVHHPVHGRVDMIGVPVKLTDCLGKVTGRAPLLGEHTHQVVSKLLTSSDAVTEAETEEALRRLATCAVTDVDDESRSRSSVESGSDSVCSDDVEAPAPATATPTATPTTSGAGAGAGAGVGAGAAADCDGNAPAASASTAAAGRPPTPPAPGFLSGVKILDLASYIAGPVTPRHLGALGAEIIKVEAPCGDAFRSHKGFQDFNQGKRGIVLNLKTEEGREAFYRLVREADVVVENMRPHVAVKLKVDYKTLSAINPRIIYLSSPGFGAYAAVAARPAFDPLLQSMSGAMLAQGGGSAPVLHTIPLNDVFTGALGAFAVAAALLHLAKTGRGQHVHASLAKTSLACQAMEFTRLEDPAGVRFAPASHPTDASTGDREASPAVTVADAGTVDPGAAPSTEFLAGPSVGERVYATAGGRHVYVEARTDVQRAALLHVVGVAAVVDPKTVARASAAAAATLAAAFEKRDLKTWVRLLDSAGVPCMPVTPCNGHWTHEAMVEAGLVVPQTNPETGKVQPRIGMLVRASRSSHTVGIRAPRLGEHTAEILASVGYSPSEISALVGCGAAACATPLVVEA